MSAASTTVRWLSPLVILGVGVGAFMALGRQPPPERKAVAKPTATSVRSIEVVPEARGLSIDLDGVVVPLREVTLAAEVPGRVVRKAEGCKAGRFVEAGTLLFEIDPRDYEFEAGRLEREARQSALAIEEIGEEMKQNAASIDLAKKQIELAGREVKRLNGLKAGRIVTEAEYDGSLREELTAVTTLTNLQGHTSILQKRKHRLEEAANLAEMMLERAKLDLSRTKIVAPIDGVVVMDHAEQDSYVSKGTPLVTIEDTSKAEIRTSLQMDELARVWRSAGLTDPLVGGAHELPDTPATVVFTVGDRRYEWDGFLSRQEGRGLDERTRALPCRVIVNEPTRVRALDRYGATHETLPSGSPRSLMRGMFVEIRVHVESPHAMVSIPEEARRPNGEVWVIRDGLLDILRPKAIQVVDGRAFFESGPSGLVAGDRVVTSQINHPRQGMPIADPLPAERTTDGKDDDT